MGVAGLGEFGGLDAVADGLGRAGARVVVGQRRDVVGAFESGGDPGVHPGCAEAAEVGDERVFDEGVDEADEAWAGLVEESGDDARV